MTDDPITPALRAALARHGISPEAAIWMPAAELLRLSGIGAKGALAIAEARRREVLALLDAGELARARALLRGGEKS